MQIHGFPPEQQILLVEFSRPPMISIRNSNPGSVTRIDMARSILTVGFELAGDFAENEDLSSYVSLLDWDIVLIRPHIAEFIHYGERFKGKPLLPDHKSHSLSNSIKHWRGEIKQYVESGKIAVVFLPPLEEVFIYTGDEEYSGTGKNRVSNQIVKPASNYTYLPVRLNPKNSEGKNMVLEPSAADALRPYWSEFEQFSKYRVKLSDELDGISIRTKIGSAPVGAIIRSTNKGSLVLLPDIDFYPDHFTEEREEEDGVVEEWTEEAITFAQKMRSCIVSLCDAINSSEAANPPPDWIVTPEFTLPHEEVLRNRLASAERDLADAVKKRNEINEELNAAGSHKALLYEKGTNLEKAIRQALELIGFEVSNYRDAISEFDEVLECPEGRLLGEAEGKDTKPINIGKFRQLITNIAEDLERDEVDAPAKGVLFGNGYRLIPPGERKCQFTDKCITSSKTHSIALVSTDQLFVAARYLSTKANKRYAKRCRESILNGVGIVKLPVPPRNKIDSPNKLTKKQQP